MNLTIEPQRPEFVGLVDGFDARAPLAPDEVRALHDGMDRFAVLVFPDQPLNDEQQLAFTRRLGRIQPAVGNNVTPQEKRRLGAEFSDVSNLNGAGRRFEREDRGRLFGFGNRLWHTDASFRPVPAKYSVLSARAVPPCGGNTEFADMRAAFEALSEDEQRRLEGLVALHSNMFSRSLLGFCEFSAAEREMFAPVRQAMVRTLPGTGRKSLYLGAHAGGIVGWPTPEARCFIFDLMEHATQPRFVHVHHWRPDDLVIWDNRQVLHRVRRFDDARYVRDMRRTTLMGDGPTTAHTGSPGR